MSKLCDQVIDVFRSIYPQARIKTEEHVRYKGQTLFLDIWIPQLNIIIEVHGRQHDEFVEHFHGDAEGFRSYRKRDRMKEEWAAEQGYTLVVLREHQLPVTKDSLLEAIYDAGSNG